MSDENKLSNTDDSEFEFDESGDENVEELDEGLESEGGEENPEDAEQIVLNQLKQTTGRDFKSLEDFQKHYKELSKFVGQNPKALKEKAEAYDKLIAEANEVVDEAEAKKKSTKTEIPQEIQELKTKIQEMELLRDYPEAKPFLETISAVSKSEGISFKEAYENKLKDLVASKLKLDESKSKEKAIGVVSKGRISSAKSNKVSQLIDDVIKTDSDEAKQALVREYLSKEE